jgi:pyruvate/2-oxoglutarate dehydrogenase complex dihydrolipoamide acyltransferase (E2) component
LRAGKRGAAAQERKHYNGDGSVDHVETPDCVGRDYHYRVLCSGVLIGAAPYDSVRGPFPSQRLESRILPEAFFMRIALIAVISSVLCAWSLQASAYADVAASPDTTSGAAKAPADASPASGNVPAAAAETPAAANSATSDEATEKSDAASAAEAAEQKAAQEKADLALFKSLGFYRKIVKGETRFCKTEYVSGSRLESVTTCRSAEQIKATLPAQK